MKKRVTKIILVGLLLQSFPTSVIAIEIDNDISESEIVATDSENGLVTDLSDAFLDNKPKEVEVINEIEKILDSEVEPIEQPSDYADSPSYKKEKIEDKVPSALLKNNETKESQEFIVEAQKSIIIDNIDYSWDWDEVSKALVVNANGGTSENVLKIIEENNMLEVQQLTFENLPEITNSFTKLSELRSLTFTNNTKIMEHGAFQNLEKLHSVNGSITLFLGSDYLFSGCKSLEIFSPLISKNGMENKNAGSFSFSDTRIKELELALNSNFTVAKTMHHDGNVFAEMLLFEGFKETPGARISVGNPEILSNVTLKDNFNGSFKLKKINILNHSGVSNSSQVLSTEFFRDFDMLESVRFSGGTSSAYWMDFEGFRYTPNLKELQFDVKPDRVLVNSVVEALPKLEKFSSNVLELGNNVFRSHPTLKEVDLPQVKKVGENVFFNTKNLSIANLPNVESISGNAFYGSGLSEINFPKLIETTGINSFAAMPNLSKVTLISLERADSQLFTWSLNLTEVHLPVLEHLPKSTFSGTGLTYINLPKVSSISSGGLRVASNREITIILPSLEINETTTYDWWSTFDSGYTIKYIEMSSIKSGEYLKEIFSQKLIKNISELKINQQAELDDTFANISEHLPDIRKVNLPMTKHLGNEIFQNMSSLKEIEAPQLETVGNRTFRSSGLTEVNFSNLISTGEYVFAETNELINVSLPKLTTLGSHAFSSSRLESISLPVLREIPERAFARGTHLNNTNLPKVEFIGSDAFQDTMSLKKIELPEVKELGRGVFYNSRIEELDLPKLTKLEGYVFQMTNNLKYLSIPEIKEINIINSMFYASELPYDMHLPGLIIHGIETDWYNQSGIEVIMTKSENQEVIKPLLEDQNNRILGIAIDGEEFIESNPILNLEVGEKISLPVRSDIVINESIEHVKAQVNNVWMHDGNPVVYGTNLIIEEVMPWNAGVYHRHLSVNHSKTNEEIFTHDSNTVSLNVAYTHELGVSVTVKEDAITIGETTEVTAVIENISNYGDVTVTVDLLNGLLGGIELIESSVTITTQDEIIQTPQLENLLIPKDKKVIMTYQVIGVNNESIENNISILLHENDPLEGKKHIWAGATRLVVKNGHLKFLSEAPEYIDFDEWDENNPLTLGAITPQKESFNLVIEDLRGSNRFAQNEIQGNRSKWRLVAYTDNVFINNNGHIDKNILKLIGKNNDGQFVELADGFTMYSHNPSKEIPLTSREHPVYLGDEARLGIMLNQINGLQEHTQYNVGITFDLIDAP